MSGQAVYKRQNMSCTIQYLVPWRMSPLKQLDLNCDGVPGQLLTSLYVRKLQVRKQ